MRWTRNVAGKGHKGDLFLKDTKESQAWLCTALIPARGRLGSTWKDFEFKASASLAYKKRLFSEKSTYRS
jgi:hypothetical protein